MPGIPSKKGEVYQYVGDEIVISWKKQQGLDQANCIRCFFEMIRRLENHSDYFISKYGVQPKFKAGLHVGFVIAGEMGIIKREIVYSGDVLNTASRIQSMCNEMQVEILISGSLINQVDVESIGGEVRELGEMSLRGKSEKIALATVRAHG